MKKDKCTKQPPECAAWLCKDRKSEPVDAQESASIPSPTNIVMLLQTFFMIKQACSHARRCDGDCSFHYQVKKLDQTIDNSEKHPTTNIRTFLDVSFSRELILHIYSDRQSYRRNKTPALFSRAYQDFLGRKNRDEFLSLRGIPKSSYFLGVRCANPIGRERCHFLNMYRLSIVMNERRCSGDSLFRYHVKKLY